MVSEHKRLDGSHAIRFIAPILFCKACESRPIACVFIKICMLIETSFHLRGDRAGIHHRGLEQTADAVAGRHRQGTQQV
jgi:hypothetical protein